MADLNDKRNYINDLGKVGKIKASKDLTDKETSSISERLDDLADEYAEKYF